MRKIYGIIQGQREIDLSGALPGVAQPGARGKIAYYMWCIKSENTTVLIDTGMDDEEARKRNIKDQKYIEGQPRTIGVDPPNVETVIITHLHADHFSAYKLYPKASFYIQKRDIEFFAGPWTRFRQTIQTVADIPEVVRLSHAKRVRYIDGDEQIAPGIRVIAAGGHTPGLRPWWLLPTDLGKVRVIGADIFDLPYLMPVIREEKVDRLIHTAAAARPHTMIRTNIGATTAVLEVARLTGVKRVVLASSGAVYHSTPAAVSGGYVEDCAWKCLANRPKEFYPVTKLTSEQIGLIYADSYGVDFAVIRLCSIFGPWQGRPIGKSGFVDGLLRGPALGRPAAIEDSSLPRSGRSCPAPKSLSRIEMVRQGPGVCRGRGP